MNAFYSLRFSNGTEATYYVQLTATEKPQQQAAIGTLCDAIAAVTYATMAEYGTRHTINQQYGLPQVDTTHSKKLILSLALTNGELQSVEVDAVSPTLINADGTVATTHTTLLGFVSQLADFAIFDGETIDITVGDGGIVAAIAI